MDVIVHGRHIDISDRFREHVTDKVSRLERFGVPLTRVDVEVTKETNPRLAERAFDVELTCRGTGPVIRAEAASGDKYAALDLAYGRLEERLRRAADRRHARYRKGGLPEPVEMEEIVAAEVEVEEDDTEADVVYEDGPIVVRDKTHETTPMTVGEALHALELVGHDFFLFHDIETGLPTVVYKRRGYDYGLLRIAVTEQGPASAAS